MKQILTPDLDFEAGYVLPIDKPFGWSSVDVVRKVKIALKCLGHKKIKIGHAGTLDPLATGVLLVCIGKATKSVDLLQSQQKEYVAEVTLGATTPSYDMEHPVNQYYPYEHITLQSLETALVELTGERLQLPPVYSAKQIDGKRGYEYARDGEQVKMRQAMITIYKMEVLKFELPTATIRVECSKGTYIRSLAMEIGEKLDSGAYLSALCRTKSGDFTVEDCFSVKEIEDILVKPKQI